MLAKSAIREGCREFLAGKTSQSWSSSLSATRPARPSDRLFSNSRVDNPSRSLPTFALVRTQCESGFQGASRSATSASCGARSPACHAPILGYAVHSHDCERRTQKCVLHGVGRQREMYKLQRSVGKPVADRGRTAQPAGAIPVLVVSQLIYDPADSAGLFHRVLRDICGACETVYSRADYERSVPERSDGRA